MHYETLAALHGVLDRYPWASHVTCDAHGSELYDLAMRRAEAYGWYSTGGWTYEYRGWGEARIVQDPGRWADALAGGDWTQDGKVRELAWMSAEIPDDVREPRLPLLHLARILSDAVNRIGHVRFTGLHAVLPLQELVGDASDDFRAMRRWFALADPAASVPVSVTVAAGPALRGREAAVPGAVSERLGDIAAAEIATGHLDVSGLADVDGEHGYDKARERGVLRLACRVPEWSVDAAVWLTEAVGDGLRAAGCAERAVVTASLASS
ncbi:hypothetical protein ABZ023_05360 [Streptomyces sp. NPDC006367]|uniref:hypothetical protein n=1 Tax=unclassified Streptomyces TaxID=2593676 RepID=UPI00339E9F9A